MAKNYPILTIVWAISFLFRTWSLADEFTECRVLGGNGEWEFLEGNCNEGFADGEGKAKSSDGEIYEGGFKQGRFDGFGVYRDTEGLKYEGYFKNGKFQEYGKISYPDGSQYAGDWKDGKYHGNGIHIRQDGVEYQGRFENGKYHGKGKILFPNGSHYSGNWVEGELIAKTETMVGQDLRRAPDVPFPENSDNEYLIECIGYGAATMAIAGCLFFKIFVGNVEDVENWPPSN